MHEFQSSVLEVDKYKNFTERICVPLAYLKLSQLFL